MSNYGTVANLPLAPDTPHNCHYYYNHYDSPNRPAIIPPAQQNLWATPPKTCETIANIINMHVEELIRLNPSLNTDPCTMEYGFSYCAGTTKTPPSTASASTTPEPPLCSFDPKKGEYTCPDPPICRFDPKKGEYDCPKPSTTAGFEQGEAEERAELR